ncbi:MAG TPA: transaldolase [Anaerolineales bacterium]|nr:transaldolase [Anaerolineales bacterium]HLO27574.1 transaldolase [Anaerolineales bacterium]
MNHTKLHTLANVGQSVWLDYIQRSLITSGGLQSYVAKGLSGVTSNPSLFEKAIAESNEYDEQIQTLGLQGKSAQEIYEELTVEDARMGADVLRPVFDETDGNDGFFSLEVNPNLAHDRQGTVNEAIRLFARVDRPNVMIKVPATIEGVSAFQELIEEGININVTLMFSLAQYDQIAEAYLTAMENRAAKVYHLKQIASVASIFVSRLDSKVDKMLEAFVTPKADALKGTIGIANAKIAYQHFKEYFQSERWQRLAEKGARVQRVLYGSTGTKNPDYSDVMYVENLIGPNTVNTIPPKTLEAFIDHGTVALTLESHLDEARAQLDSLPELGINLDDVTQELLDEGVENFVKPYHSLLQAISEKKVALIAT